MWSVCVSVVFIWAAVHKYSSSVSFETHDRIALPHPTEVQCSSVSANERWMEVMSCPFWAEVKNEYVHHHILFSL